MSQSIPAADFYGGVQKLCDRAISHIELGGMYVADEGVIKFFLETSIFYESSHQTL